MPPTTHLDPLDGTIRMCWAVVFQGGMSEYQLRLGPTLLRTVAPVGQCQAGDRAWIAIQPERGIPVRGELNPAPAVPTGAELLDGPPQTHQA